MANVEVSRAQRLDQRVVELIPQLSRAFAAKLIEQGKVTVNGVVQLKAGHKLREDDIVHIDYDVAEMDDIPDIDLEVIYEDDDCVVINKPVGLLTHSKGAFNPEPTVATWLRRHIEDEQPEGLPSSGGSRAGIVHRLDRATSGVMICAKTPEALSWLQKQFATRRTKKKYFAVIEGKLAPDHAVIDMPIERNPKAPATFRVGANGKTAKTTYRVIESSSHGDEFSLVELTPETGRTHQLRVHMAQLKHPIIGDVLYGGKTADRLYLHAASLEVTILKDHTRMVFTVPVPQQFKTKLT